MSRDDTKNQPEDSDDIDLSSVDPGQLKDWQEEADEDWKNSKKFGRQVTGDPRPDNSEAFKLGESTDDLRNTAGDKISRGEDVNPESADRMIQLGKLYLDAQVGHRFVFFWNDRTLGLNYARSDGPNSIVIARAWNIEDRQRMFCYFKKIGDVFAIARINPISQTIIEEPYAFTGEVTPLFDECFMPNVIDPAPDILMERVKISNIKIQRRGRNG